MHRIGKFIFYIILCYGALWSFWSLRDLYRYWRLDAQTIGHVEEAWVQELSPSRFAIIATYSYFWPSSAKQPLYATSSLEEPYQLNRFSAEKAKEALKQTSPVVYVDSHYPKRASLKRVFPFKPLLHAGVTLGIALYLWVLDLYARTLPGAKRVREERPRPSPLKGKYLLQNLWANRILVGIDFLLGLIPKRKPAAIPVLPGSFLITNLAHMGDVLLMTSIISVLKQNFPKARIGVLVGSWSRPLVDNHPAIDAVHIIDYWKHNRANLSRWQKLRSYIATRKRALQEIRESRYEVAIDAYYYFGNAIPLLWQARIPTRIGYTSGGFGPLLTHGLDWASQDQPLVHYYLPLLEFLQIPREVALQFLRPALPPIPVFKRELPLSYVVMHVGTGSPLKEWPLAHWKELVKKFAGYPLIFTGRGPRERAIVENIVHEVEGCTNYVDELSWEEYLAVLKRGELLIGVDSLAGHLAAALDLPSVLIYSGMSNQHQWKPLNTRCKIFTSAVPCAPCYRSRGCDTMECVRKVSPEEVYQGCREFLS